LLTPARSTVDGPTDRFAIARLGRERLGYTTESRRTPANWPSSAVAGDCGGAVDSLLAALALRLGRLDEAGQHAQAGLTLDTRVGAEIWINRSKDPINRIDVASRCAQPGAPACSERAWVIFGS